MAASDVENGLVLKVLVADSLEEFKIRMLKLMTEIIQFVLMVGWCHVAGDMSYSVVIEVDFRRRLRWRGSGCETLPSDTGREWATGTGTDITRKGSHQSQKVINALVLLNCDESPSNAHRPTGEEVVDIPRSRQRKIDRVKRQFLEEGLEAALGGRQGHREHYQLRRMEIWKRDWLR